MAKGRGFVWLFALLLVGLLVGCSKSKSPSSPGAGGTEAVASSTAAPSPTAVPTPVPTPSPPPPVAWAPCGKLECGTLSVPLDYAQPAGRRIDISLIRQKALAPANRLGALIVNFGGPGLSGVDRLRDRATSFPQSLQNQFDLVSFDPRGVGSSSPAFTCQDDSPDKDDTPNQPWPTTDDQWAAIIASAKHYSDICTAKNKDILPFLGTREVAMDLDQLRQALGEDKINFLGNSYGSVIGEVYADMYPNNIRSMTMDGVVDGALPAEDWMLNQALGLEGALQRFVDDCRAKHCISSAGGDPMAAIDQMIEKAKAGPLKAPGADRGAGAYEVYLALLQTLYSSASWPTLASFVDKALGGNATAVVNLADSYLGRQSDGTYDNSGDMNLAVNCLDRDFSRDPARTQQLATKLAMQAPHFGPPVAQGGANCAYWGSPAKTLRIEGGKGAPPLLLIGATGDPFAPYREAVAVSKRMTSSVLLTYDGESHPAFMRGISCVDNAVTHYFLTVETPAPGTVCGSAGITPVPPVP